MEQDHVSYSHTIKVELLPSIAGHRRIWYLDIISINQEQNRLNSCIDREGQTMGREDSTNLIENLRLPSFLNIFKDLLS